MAEDNLAVTVQDSGIDADFDAIHDAFMDSDRGRWFLVEFARRNRHADTALLLAAIGRIESILLAQRAVQTLPSPHPDSAAHANPGAIKPDGDSGSKSAIADALGDSIARLRAAIDPLREVSWSLREQGDMRCDLLDRQAVEIAQTCTAFEALRRELGGAARNEMPQPQSAAPAPLAASHVPPPVEADAAVMPEPVAEQAEDDPLHAQNFSFAPLIEELQPPVQPSPEREASPRKPQHTSETAEADDPFADMLFETEADAAKSREAESAPAPSSSDAPFDSSQTKRLSRLINLFAGSRDAAAPAATHDMPPAKGATFVPDEIAAKAPATGNEISARAETEVAPTEPADFLLEPWPRVSDAEPVQAAAAPASDPVMEKEPGEQPAMKDNAAPAASISPSPAVSAASLFPMQRAAPADPLAPIVALSDEEKIALFS